MAELATKLCEEFIFVRVDFYEIAGKIYFGELTFMPSTGNVLFKTKEADLAWGNLLKLPPEFVREQKLRLAETI